MKAPDIGPLLLQPGDRLAIIGDSITEQKMYSRIIEDYVTACLPELKITVRQLGWSGETAEGFRKRMDSDCLRFRPTVATLCYGMNDAKYRMVSR
jgi:lysophospholipase L1-like esterase